VGFRRLFARKTLNTQSVPKGLKGPQIQREYSARAFKIEP